MRTAGPHDPMSVPQRVLVSGRWIHEDEELVVASEVANSGLRGVLVGEDTRVYESLHFTVFTLGAATVVLHRLEPAAIDNDLAELIAGELVRSGHVAIPRAFERCFAGVVLSSAPNSKDAWRAFYDNTLSKLQRVASGSSYPGLDSDPIAVFGRIYKHARTLVAGSSLLDVGTCFGFFPLLLQQSHPRIDTTALDVSAPILQLARDAVPRDRAETVTFVCGDARALPFAGGSFDTVTVLHVLEHLEPSSASRALQEMCRVARRRVIVAVPLEKEPDPAYDHVQGFDREGLLNFGEKTGWHCRFEDYLGGWLILEPS